MLNSRLQSIRKTDQSVFSCPATAANTLQQQYNTFNVKMDFGIVAGPAFARVRTIPSKATQFTHYPTVLASSHTNTQWKPSRTKVLPNLPW